MPSIIEYAKNRDEKRILEEIKTTNGVKYVGHNNETLVIAFCGYKPNLDTGIIELDVELDIQQKALRKLNNEINTPVNPKMWSVGYVKPPTEV